MAVKFRGLYAVTPSEDNTATLDEKVRAALAGGARIVQYRNKTATAQLALEQARLLRQLTHSNDALLIVNDDVELAIATGADGVHVGREDATLERVRAHLSGVQMTNFVIGVSCYDSLVWAREAVVAGASYVAFGSFFSSSTKPGAVRAPLDLVGAGKRELSVPVVAIGGITVENAPELVAAGADAIAVISALFDANDIAGTARQLSSLYDQHV